MTAIRKFADALLGVDRIIVNEGYRALVSLDGRYEGLYGPGEHSFITRDKQFVVRQFKIADGNAVDPALVTLTRERADLAEGHLMEVRTGPGEAAAVFRDSVLFGLMKPDARSVLWVEAGPWAVERYDVTGDLRVPQALAKRIVKPRLTDPVKRVRSAMIRSACCSSMASRPIRSPPACMSSGALARRSRRP